MQKIIRKKIIRKKNTKIVIEQNGKKIELNNTQIIDLLRQQQDLINKLQRELVERNIKLDKRDETINNLLNKDNSENNISILDKLTQEDNDVLLNVNKIN